MTLIAAADALIVRKTELRTAVEGLWKDMTCVLLVLKTVEDVPTVFHVTSLETASKAVCTLVFHIHLARERTGSG